MAEKLFTVVGTTKNPETGETKMRWANDLAQRINILIKAGCENIDLHETPKPMTKLDAAKWLRDNKELSPDQQEVVDLKIAEKEKQAKRAEKKATITKNVKRNAKKNKATDPRVEKFIEENLSDTEKA